MKNSKTSVFIFVGSLDEEEEVLQWLITQKTEDRIELITRVMLEDMVEETQYLAVYFCKFLAKVTPRHLSACPIYVYIFTAHQHRSLSISHFVSRVNFLSLYFQTPIPNNTQNYRQIMYKTNN